MSLFKLKTKFSPEGDQPAAIKKLVERIQAGKKHQVLLGVTGSGKTFSLANVVAQCNKPTLVLAPNKTLAAQLFAEFSELFPENAVEYFVSYYDYYQPEAYIPRTDTFIEKDASRNNLIDRLRLSATRSLLTRPDVIVVSSVSCIYGLGKPATYISLKKTISVGQEIDRNQFLHALIEMQYERNDYDFVRGNFRVLGDIIDIYPAYEDKTALRFSFWGDEIDAIHFIDPITSNIQQTVNSVHIYPATHYAASKNTVKDALGLIGEDLEIRLKELEHNHQNLEYQRLKQRVNYDLEMMEEVGHCSGIENYSRYLDKRQAGEAPFCLLDYFPKDWLMLIDESHISIPQIGGMFKGDKARKTTLVNFGFRLPSALDNRPLRFDEFCQRTHQTIYVSATPGEYECNIDKAEAGADFDGYVEQIIRPTGLTDPEIEIRDADQQVQDIMIEIRKRATNNERVLITVLTKRMAEDLSGFLLGEDIRVEYLHSDIDTVGRIEIIKNLRAGKFDVLVGINLLREGLDLPEVSLVAIFDADRQGFLRSKRSLIQTIGRAARNVNGKVILYARKITDAMKTAIEETDRRREIQKAYNIKHNITPQTIIKSLDSVLNSIFEADYVKIEDDPLEKMFQPTSKKKRRR